MADFDIGLTLGAFLVAQIITSVLFGHLTSQTYLYFFEFPEDSKRLKFAVATLWILELAHIICSSWGLYSDTIDYFGHPEHLLLVPKVFLISLLLAGFIFPLVQLIFADRIYRMSGNKYILAFLIFMAVVRFIGSMANFAVLWRTNTIMEYIEKYSWFIPTLLALGVLTDLVIAMTLIYYFRQQRLRMFKGTVKIIDTLTLWTIESGVATTVIGIASVLTTILLSNTYVWIALLLIITRLYSNMMLASLNGRVRLRALKEESIALNTSDTRPRSGGVFRVMSVSQSHNPTSPTRSNCDQKGPSSPLSPTRSKVIDLEASYSEDVSVEIQAVAY